MQVSAIASAIFDALTSGLTGLVSAVPTAMKDTFENFFFTTTGSGSESVTSLSNIATVLLIFGGVSLAFGLCKLVWNLVTSKIGR